MHTFFVSAGTDKQKAKAIWEHLIFGSSTSINPCNGTGLRNTENSLGLLDVHVSGRNTVAGFQRRRELFL